MKFSLVPMAQAAREER